ncbi:MAG: hypothetical protein KDD82_07745 [Planctomycetes bacterium]|nr:hypothetical protein [Planctomycetota bacterium]
MVAHVEHEQAHEQGDAIFSRSRPEALSERVLDGLERELATGPDTVLVEASQLRDLVRAARRVRQLESEAEIQSWRIKLEAQELALQLLRDL